MSNIGLISENDNSTVLAEYVGLNRVATSFQSEDALEKELINTLKNIGITNINILFDMNPYILSFDASDIKSIYDNKLKEGLTKEEIINLFNYNSFSII